MGVGTEYINENFDQRRMTKNNPENIFLVVFNNIDKDKSLEIQASRAPKFVLSENKPINNPLVPFSPKVLH